MPPLTVALSRRVPLSRGMRVTIPDYWGAGQPLDGSVVYLGPKGLTGISVDGRDGSLCYYFKRVYLTATGSKVAWPRCPKKGMPV